jgi:hypothetical protein
VTYHVTGYPIDTVVITRFAVQDKENPAADLSTATEFRMEYTKGSLLFTDNVNTLRIDSAAEIAGLRERLKLKNMSPDVRWIEMAAELFIGEKTAPLSQSDLRKIRKNQ